MAKSKRFILADAADELARLQDIAAKTAEEIELLKERILDELEPLTEPHTELRGRQSLWDIRSLPVTAVRWKAIAEALKPSARLVANNTTERVQVSFKRLPLEVSKA